MSLFERPRRSSLRPKQSTPSILSGRGIAIAVLVVVSGASFALGFYVGKATTGGGTAVEATYAPLQEPPQPATAEDAAADEYAGVVSEPAPEAVVEEPRYEAEVAPPGSGFSVQVGAFSNIQEALQMRDGLARKGYDAYVAEDPGGAGDSLYKVRVGSFAEKDDAKRMVLELKREERLSAFIAEAE